MKKYCEIENSYRSKHIEYFDDVCGVCDKLYVLQEKIDGSCIRVHVTPDGNVTCGSRNRVLNSDENFHNHLDALSKLDLSSVIYNAKNNNIEITLYGELFSNSIQKRVTYYDDTRIMFFDVRYDGHYLPWVNAKYFLNKYGLPIVPVVSDMVPLNDALNYDVENLKSLVNPDAPDDNHAEGVVIKPMFEELYSGHDRFVLKRKHPKFHESENKKKNRAQKPADPMIDKWKHSVSEYVTENRLLSLFSKKGEINNPKQIGEYIKEYMEDVRKDFVKDYPEFMDEDLTKKQDKDIFNHSKDVVKMLNGYL